jgi:4-hydroxythreonine-4-phosphate dehydrogenase
MGDAAGIGPELIVKAYQERKIFDKARFIVIGDTDVIDEARKAVKSKIQINRINSARMAKFEKGILDLIDLDNLSKESFALGKEDKAIGRASGEYLERAVKLALDGEIDAITSAPVNKAALHLGGYRYPGQTEMIADLTGTRRFEMMLIFGPLRMFYVTNHVSLRYALDSVKEETVLEKLFFIHETLSEFNETKPIAVAALNPHAGESGKLGREEIDEIVPAIEKAEGKGINVLGPFPADTLFIRAKEEIFGAVLAMYHDQGNIAAKLLNVGSGVTYVCGLPFVRTSVAHGTAFDIAGRGIASADAFIQAIVTAADLVMQKRKPK